MECRHGKQPKSVDVNAFFQWSAVTASIASMIQANVSDENVFLESSAATASTARMNMKRTALHCMRCGTYKAQRRFRHERDHCKECEVITCAKCNTPRLNDKFRRNDIRHHFSARRAIACVMCRAHGHRVRPGPKQKTRKSCKVCGFYQDITCFPQNKRSSVCKSCRTLCCTGCGVHQHLTAFRWSRGRRIQLCRTCERVTCAACRNILPQEKFHRKHITHHFSHARKVLCLTCLKLGKRARCA